MGSLSHLGSAMATTCITNASIVHGYRHYNNQNLSGIYFGRCVKEDTPSAISA
jgi:hypothetical protein